LRALDTLEGAWAPLSAKGDALVFVRAVEWFVIRYNIFSASDQARPRKIMFEIKLQQRRGEPWWYVKRTDIRDREGDDVDAALKPLWNSEGEGWRGMRVSAVAQPAGMEELIRRLDDVMRNLASDVPVVEQVPAPAPASTQVKPPQRAPEAPMIAQQRQQPTPNHSQGQSQSQGKNTPNQSQGRSTPNQSQGRATTIKREWEVVEID
jgi:mediator of RNA polymerase II transcription subunit 14